MNIETPDDMHEACRRLGELWGLGRRLGFAELARCLELQPRLGSARSEFDLGQDVCRRPTGPQRVAVQAMLEGFVPRNAPACVRR